MENNFFTVKNTVSHNSIQTSLAPAGVGGLEDAVLQAVKELACPLLRLTRLPNATLASWTLAEAATLEKLVAAYSHFEKELTQEELKELNQLGRNIPKLHCSKTSSLKVNREDLTLALSAIITASLFTQNLGRMVKRQHYLPRFLLARRSVGKHSRSGDCLVTVTTVEDGRLTTTEVRDSAFIHRTESGAAHQFYTPQLEAFFAQLEGRVNSFTVFTPEGVHKDAAITALFALTLAARLPTEEGEFKVKSLTDFIKAIDLLHSQFKHVHFLNISKRSGLLTPLLNTTPRIRVSKDGVRSLAIPLGTRRVALFSNVELSREEALSTSLKHSEGAVIRGLKNGNGIVGLSENQVRYLSGGLFE